MSQSQPHQELTMQSSEQENMSSCNQACCARVAVYMTNLYSHGQSQLQSMYQHLQLAQSEIGNTRRQILAIEKELQQERKASELFNQQFIELQECHDKLLKEYESCTKVQEDLNKSATESRMFADEVARRAESLLNNSRANLVGGDVEGSQNGQSISEMILESAKNALLVQEISSQHSENDDFAKLRYVMDQNVDFQYHNMELGEKIKTLSQQVEDGKNEVASLNKALEIATEDGRRKKSRRGKSLAGKNQ
ncbi:hypothetical protein GGP41_007861 [Bipolaris sorokiniana]|uniref:Uncharacterized protein n=1 Tax=Cochliobolus sativus TaxID=45130 RepID=A0A8H5ZNT3_COCSA|nr:hypothetical protein GGP41_007861 [Bipolaris sorokiniana]